jgi:hypothetical protein
MKSFCLKFMFVLTFFFRAYALDEMTSLTLLELKKKSDKSKKLNEGKEKKNHSNYYNKSNYNKTSHYNETLDDNKNNNKNNSSKDNTSPQIQSNYTFEINKTANNSDCVPECTLNCQMHFVDPTEQKFCLINVCHCELIETNPNVKLEVNILAVKLKNQSADNLNNANNTKNIYNENSENNENNGNIIHIMDTPNNNSPDYKLNETQEVEKENFYILVVFLFVIFVPLWLYSIVRMVQTMDKSEMVCYEFPYDVKNEYMLMGEFHE